MDDSGRHDRTLCFASSKRVLLWWNEHLLSELKKEAYICPVIVIKRVERLSLQSPLQIMILCAACKFTERVRVAGSGLGGRGKVSVEDWPQV